MGSMTLFFYLLATASLFITSVVAEVYKYQNYEKTVKAKSERLTGNYSAFRLQNGLDVIFHVHDDYHLPLVNASITIGVGTSGVSKKRPILTQPTPGLAHLLEHCLSFASEKFPIPYESHEFLSSFEGYSNAFTSVSITSYELTIRNVDRISESFERFGQMFISPIFTSESVKAQTLIVNNEWIKVVHRSDYMKYRLAQLLMTNGQPSELFIAGNAESLRDITAEDVELFWKTHYTADNMKLAISVNQDYMDVVKDAVFEYFSQIKASEDAYNLPNVYDPSNVSFWSKEHVNKYLKVYTENARRNHLFLYWHIHCDDGALCNDSLELVRTSITNCLKSQYNRRNLSVDYYQYSYDEFVIVVSIQVRDKELPGVNSLKHKIIEMIKLGASSTVDGLYSSIFVQPSNIAESLSNAMMVSPSLDEAPLRAYHPFVYSNRVNELRKTYLKMILDQKPRMIVSHKSTHLEYIEREEILMDPYYFIYYQFANENDNLPELSLPIPKHFLKTKFSVKLKIDNIPLTYPYQFIIGVFIEALLIELNNKMVYYEHTINNGSIQIEVFFKNDKSSEPIMRDLVQSFSSLKLSRAEVFEKAKKSWVLEMKNKTSTLILSSIADYYASILSSENFPSESILLISDPNPENVTFEEVQKAGCFLKEIGALTVTTTSFSKIDSSNLIKKLTQMWADRNFYSNYVSTIRQPGKDQTFMYVPPYISTANNGVMMLFNLDESFPAYSNVLQIILYRLLYKRLRSEMGLSYTPKIGITSGKYIHVMVTSCEAPEIIQNAILSVMQELPDYIRGIDDSYMEYILPKHESRLSLIDVVEKYMIGNEAGRLIIQLWGKDQRAAREDYLAKMRNDPSLTIIESIKSYPIK